MARGSLMIALAHSEQTEEEAMNRFMYCSALALACALVALALPTAALAQDGEVSFVIGALVGGDIEADVDQVTSGFDNSPLYGGRAGIYGYPWGIEGSVVVSPSGLASSAVAVPSIDTQVTYAEVNVLLIPIPGPVSIFGTGGIGLHRFDFDEAGLGAENRLGFNFGGGVKAALGPVALRADVRDHLTNFDPEDLSPSLAALLGLTDGHRLHNWEVSAGVGFRF